MTGKPGEALSFILRARPRPSSPFTLLFGDTAPYARSAAALKTGATAGRVGITSGSTGLSVQFPLPDIGPRRRACDAPQELMVLGRNGAPAALSAVLIAGWRRSTMSLITGLPGTGLSEVTPRQHA